MTVEMARTNARPESTTARDSSAFATIGGLPTPASMGRGVAVQKSHHSAGAPDGTARASDRRSSSSSNHGLPLGGRWAWPRPGASPGVELGRLDGPGPVGERRRYPRVPSIGMTPGRPIRSGWIRPGPRDGGRETTGRLVPAAAGFGRTKSDAKGVSLDPTRLRSPCQYVVEALDR